jgi:hypothetical protein
MTISAASQRVGLYTGLIRGASDAASMKLSHVKKTACPLG